GQLGMKTAAALSGIAAFLCAIALLSLGETRRSVSDLRDRFARSQVVLDQTRTQLLQLPECRPRAAIVAAPAPDVPALLQQDILGPSVQVNVQGSVGGVTLRFSRETHSYVVTAHHVIQKILLGGADAETR